MIQRTTYGNVSVATPPEACVPARYRDRVADLFSTWESVTGRNAELRRYYQMKNQMRSLGISIPPMLERVNSVVGWCKKAVDARAVRSVFDGYAFDGDEDERLERLVRENRLRSKYQQACASALAYGVAALTVMRGGPGQPEVVIRTFSANQFCALWDKDAERIACGVVLADVDRNGDASKYVCHMPEAVLTLERDGEGEWRCSEEPHPLGRPMMEVIVNDPDPDRPMGHSLLTPELLGITDKAMRDVLRMEVGAEFFTFPQRYILGADDDLFSLPAEGEGEGADGDEAEGDEGEGRPRVPDPIAKYQAYVGSWLALTRDENGDLPQVGQFAAPSADNFTRVFENDAQRFSGATNVPLAQLGVLSNTYTSSEALGAANDPLIIEVEAMNRRNGEAMESVARMAMAVRDGVPLSGLTDEQWRVQALFEDPSMPTISARADAWTKWGSEDKGIVGTDVWYEGMGLPKAKVDRIKREKNQASATATLNAIADAIEARAAGAALPPGGGAQ